MSSVDQVWHIIVRWRHQRRLLRSLAVSLSLFFAAAAAVGRQGVVVAALWLPLDFQHTSPQ